MIRNKLMENKWDWTTYTLPKPNHNQNPIFKKHFRENNSQAIKARSWSETNCQKILKTEQLTIYQSQVRIKIKMLKNTLDWTTYMLSKPDDNQNQIVKNTWDWTTHNLPKSDQNQNHIFKKTMRLNNSQATIARTESELNCQKYYLRLNNSHAIKARSESESNCQKHLRLNSSHAIKARS